MFNTKIQLATLALAALCGQAFAGDADFTLKNRTGYDLREVYISPTHKNSWGNDRLGKNLFENGNNRLFKFSDKSSCEQDLMVVFDDDGSKVVWEGVNLCELETVTIKYNRQSGETPATAD